MATNIDFFGRFAGFFGKDLGVALEKVYQQIIGLGSNGSERNGLFFGESFQ